MSTTFSALAMNLTYLREAGVLKRIHGTPLPTSAYLAGIFGNAVTNTAIQIAIVTTVGAIALRPRLAAATRSRSSCSPWSACAASRRSASRSPT